MPTGGSADGAGSLSSNHGAGRLHADRDFAR
jgi:hypothetical protein